MTVNRLSPGPLMLSMLLSAAWAGQWASAHPATDEPGQGPHTDVDDGSIVEHARSLPSIPPAPPDDYAPPRGTRVSLYSYGHSAGALLERVTVYELSDAPASDDLAWTLRETRVGVGCTQAAYRCPVDAE